MNRREMFASLSILPLIGKQKIRLDRLVKITIGLKIGEQTVVHHVLTTDTYFELESVKQIIKENDIVILEDGNKNILKVNKLNKGFVLFKLDLIK